MKNRKRFLSLMISLGMLFSLLIRPGTVFAEDASAASSGMAPSEEWLPDVITEEEAAENGYVSRFPEAEPDLNTLVFRNADGTNTMRIFDHPVKYLDENGAVKDITLAVKASQKGFVSEQSAVRTEFPKTLSEGITLAYNDIGITLIPQQAVPEETESETELTASLSADKRTVSYSCGEKTSFEYSLTYTGFKEDIVVSEYTGQTEYYFLLNTNDLILKNLDGSYYLTDGEGEIRATVGDIIIFTADERNNAFGSMTHETVKEGKQYILTIHIDGDYLKDEKTVYPIRIDPTIEINYDGNGAGAIEDVTLNSLDSSSPNSGSLFVGKRETYGISRTLMRFPGLDLSEISSAFYITEARVELRDLMCYSTHLPVSCYAFKGSWDISTVRWSNVSPDNYDTTELDSKVVYYRNGDYAITGNYERYSFDITQAVKWWKSGTYSQNSGIIFKTTNEIETGSTNISVCFASYNRSSNKPSFTMVYSNPYAANPSDYSLFDNRSSNDANGLSVDSKLQKRANCYGFAMRFLYSGETIPSHFTSKSRYAYLQQPGEFGNKESVDGKNNYQMIEDLHWDSIRENGGYTISFVMDMIEMDFEKLGYSILSTAKYSVASQIPPANNDNKRLILLVVGDMSESGDYHFYIQNSDNTWSHKPGQGYARNVCRGFCGTETLLTNNNILQHCHEGGYSSDYIFFYIDKPSTIDYCHGDGTASTCMNYTPLELSDVAGADYAHSKGIVIGTSGSTTFSGMMDYGTDNDCYAFDATQTKTYTINLTTTKNGGPYSYPLGMQLYTSDSQLLGGSVYGGNGTITAELTKGEIYYIRLYVINPYFDHWRGYVVNIY